MSSCRKGKISMTTRLFVLRLTCPKEFDNIQGDQVDRPLLNLGEKPCTIRMIGKTLPY